MRLTITGANCRFARAVIDALSGEHTIRAVDTRFDSGLPASVETAVGDLRDRDFAGQVSEGADAVLHLAPLSIDGLDDSAVIDTFSRGAYNLVDMAIEQGVSRFLLASTLGMFDRLPAEWRIDESWRPRPEPIPEHLACWLSELSLRESCHTAPIHSLCLRFGQIVDDAEIAGRAFDPRWLHIEDAVESVRCALRILEEKPTLGEWQIYHISSGDRARIRPGRARGDRFGYQPRHTFADIAAHRDELPPTRTGANWRKALQPQIASPSASSTPRPSGMNAPTRPRNIVIFGSGGPVAASLAAELKDHYVLRQTDFRPLSEIRGENHPQSEGAPLPTILGAPHEERTVDIRDYEQVLAACEGMDAAVNCTVMRPDAVEAFRVNTLGAYNLMRGAVQCGIKRVVQTGPQQMMMDGRSGYWWDYDVPGNAPARPGRNLYAHSKFLGQEICRVFAEYYGLEVPVLVYAQFLNPRVAKSVWTMAVSWEDSARALRRAIEVDPLPSPYEEMAITNDLPHGKYSASRAKEILGWEAQDDLSPLWTRRTEG